ncbi:HAMP domain-containing sensor histidine kinase [Massilia sp. CF038]|uniref:sensor histidine kinase n=1 Tax=Massilia sp. CF038 TaxID=1881045 RepID=UPI000923E485|nr:HAMP domain-containing sensor histidine kinase [Massilia sp. CF038]SHG71573.1 Signal transduction histidine kinase [Massilia sp. CF038]
MIEQFHLYLILIGLTIGSVMAALWYKARQASMLNLELIRLNEQLGFDAPAFLRHAWGLLARSSLRGMQWELDWFGVQTREEVGVAKGRPAQHRVEVGEMALVLTVYRHDGRGEQRYFEEGLIETLLLLLRTDMLIKAGTTDAALSHMSKLNLFLQHDMKNIAQFIQLMSDQLAAVPAGKEHKVLDYLRVATPLIRHRADRIVRTLTVGAAPSAAGQPVPLRPLLEKLCALYDLECQIDGDAAVATDPNVLETVLDNILKNYKDASARENITHLLLEFTVTAQNDTVQLTVQAPAAPRAAAPERMFEPFWSSTPDGLGIGLYQARHLIEMQGGSLSVSQDDGQPLRFHLHCPVADSTGLSS